MATVSVYLQAANEGADHQLYGLVTAVDDNGGTNNRITAGGSGHEAGGASGLGAPFPASVVGKTIHRYLYDASPATNSWNASPRGVPISTGTVLSRTSDTRITTSFGNWVAGSIESSPTANVWVIDYANAHGGFGKGDKSGPLTTAGSKLNTGTQHYVEHSADISPNDNLIPKDYRTKHAENFFKTGENDSDPGTTKWELRCDNLTRAYTNAAIPLPIPVQLMGDQYYNKMIDIGMRNETITMSGTLVDRGTPTASNPRLQTLFDLIRTQTSVTIGANDEEQGMPSKDTGPDNVRNYLALTIGAGYEPSDYTDSVGAESTEPTLKLNTNLIVRDRNFALNDSDYGATRTTKTFRGMVTQFSASQVGGRPDIWTWNMTFYVVKNEHDWAFPAS